MKYFIKTFGCAQNHADSERVAAAYKGRGFTKARSYKEATHVIINTCMVRESAEHRVFGLVHNLSQLKAEKHARGEDFRIIVTGCMVGVAFRDASGAYLARIRQLMPSVDEFMPIEEVGFNNEPLRQSKGIGWVPISNGCNNFCTFCIVPFTRGREISRPVEAILEECQKLKNEGYTEVMLLGQNVNSYGSDLIIGPKNIQVMRDISKTYFETDVVKELKSFAVNGENVEPVYVKHLGRQRIPTLFPYLLEQVAMLGFKKVDFISSNPWDFSDALIDVIARNKNITRTLHLPVQSGDSAMLKKMNRWYSREDYLALIEKIKAKVTGVHFTTDIIVGFCGETEEQFENTMDLARQVGFDKAFIAMYSERPMTAATKVFEDSVPHKIKKDRWLRLNELINTTLHYKTHTSAATA